MATCKSITEAASSDITSTSTSTTVTATSSPSVAEEYVVKKYDDFEDIVTKETLLRGIFGFGFEKPSKIQSIAIKPIIDRQDMIAQSQSGTGKTGAFTIGILDRIDESIKTPQAIIMANTKELSEQINTVLVNIATYMDIKSCLCVGKISVAENIKNIRDAQILVGTPGRILHLAECKAFDPKKVNIFVMDEADELLSPDFCDQTKKVISILSGECQICIFSATLPDSALDLTENFMENPLRLLIESDKLSLKLIAQFFIDVEKESYKLEILEDLYTKFSISQCMIYVNSVSKAEWLKEQLDKSGHAVECIHGQMDSVSRLETMRKFRGGLTRVLISTDLLARGIDIQQVGYVINYDLPCNPDTFINTYLHRIGRSGRFGKKGVAINFVAGRRDRNIMKDIERFYNVRIGEMPEVSVINAYLSK